jgi:hypothetical protein
VVLRLYGYSVPVVAPGLVLATGRRLKRMRDAAVVVRLTRRMNALAANGPARTGSSGGASRPLDRSPIRMDATMARLALQEVVDVEVDVR